jgi:hypothetical protein
MAFSPVYWGVMYCAVQQTSVIEITEGVFLPHACFAEKA